MIGAIIQAIDHAMGRTQKGMSAGIDVANSQHGGAAGSAATSNEQIDTSKTGENIKSATNGAAKQVLGTKIGGAAGSGASEGAAGAGGAAGATAGAGVLPEGAAGAGGASAGADAAAGSGAAEGIAGAAGSVLSDAKAKESKKISAKTAAENTVSNWRKARNYGANASKGFANAGALATGQGKQYDIESPSIVDFNKDATKDFKAESTNIKKSKEGK